MPATKALMRNAGGPTQICQRVCGLCHTQDHQRKEHQEPHNIFSVSKHPTVSKGIKKCQINTIDVRFTCPYLLVLSQELPQVEIKLILKAERLDMGRRGVMWLLLISCENQSMQMRAVKAWNCHHAFQSCGSGTTVSFWIGGSGLGHIPVSDVEHHKFCLCFFLWKQK